VSVGGVGAVVGPQVVLQILTELQQHHAVNSETDKTTQYTVVSVLDSGAEGPVFK